MMTWVAKFTAVDSRRPTNNKLDPRMCLRDSRLRPSSGGEGAAPVVGGGAAGACAIDHPVVRMSCGGAVPSRLLKIALFVLLLAMPKL